MPPRHQTCAHLPTSTHMIREGGCIIYGGTYTSIAYMKLSIYIISVRYSCKSHPFTKQNLRSGPRRSISTNSEWQHPTPGAITPTFNQKELPQPVPCQAYHSLDHARPTTACTMPCLPQLVPCQAYHSLYHARPTTVCTMPGLPQPVPCQAYHSLYHARPTTSCTMPTHNNNIHIIKTTNNGPKMHTIKNTCTKFVIIEIY